MRSTRNECQVLRTRMLLISVWWLLKVTVHKKKRVRTKHLLFGTNAKLFFFLICSTLLWASKNNFLFQVVLPVSLSLNPAPMHLSLFGALRCALPQESFTSLRSAMTVQR